MSLSALLTRDAFTLTRPAGGSDVEGNPITTRTTVGQYRLTWGSPSSFDTEIANRAGTVVEAVAAGSCPARIGDVMEGLRGASWVVTHVRPVVTHSRYFLRRL